jgi:transcription termination factor Rho
MSAAHREASKRVMPAVNVNRTMPRRGGIIMQVSELSKALKGRDALTALGITTIMMSTGFREQRIAPKGRDTRYVWD